jgi:hypothetical protein
VRLLDHDPRVADRTAAAGVLHEHAEQLALGQPADRSSTRTSMPSGTARVCTTAIVWGWQSASTTKAAPAGALLLRRVSVMASAAAVASSSRLAPAMSRPVRSVMTVWKFSSASSRPWLISGW